MDYIEFHINKKDFERFVFLSAIIILLIVAVIAYKKSPGSCPEIECNSTNMQNSIQTPVIEINPIPQTEAQEEQLSEQPSVYYVDMKNMNFAPKEMTIENNSIVIFENKELHTAHKLYEVRNLFMGPRMEPGAKFNYTFTVLGNYTVWSITGKDTGMKTKIEVIP